MKVCDMWKLNLAPLDPKWAAGGTPLEFGTELAMLPEPILSGLMNTAVGVEIEVENAIPLHGLMNWITDRDDSLRDSGCEYKTRYGLRIWEIPIDLANLHSSFNKYIPNRRYSERCSVHVHLDVRRWDEKQLQNLLALYTIVEQGLFNLAGPQRGHNIFCVPVNQGAETGFKDVWSYIDHNHKYSALNTACLREFGTVEFRHMEGTDDPKRLWQWIILLGLLHRAAATMDHETLKFEINKMKTDSQYDRFLRKVFYSFLQYLPWYHPEIDTAVSNSKCFFWKVVE